MLAAAQGGDTVVVTRLDRLGRSLPDLLALVEDLAGRDVGLRSLGEQIDTTCATGRLVLHVFGALAEFERPHAGAHDGWPGGRTGSRPRRRPATGFDRRPVGAARDLATAGTPMREIAELLGIARSTAYSSLRPR
jgi:DNA invertase Pin-like site-specific DNA recombinase